MCNCLGNAVRKKRVYQEFFITLRTVVCRHILLCFIVFFNVINGILLIITHIILKTH